MKRLLMTAPDGSLSAVAQHCRWRGAVLVFALTAAVPSAFASDSFTLVDALAARAVTSCSDMTVSDGLIDSAGLTTTSAPRNRGDIASNGNIKVSGGMVDGNATAGPGKTVTRSGSGTITGMVSSAASALSCTPIDLAPIAASLQSGNDNARIPLTSQHKNPLTGANHTEFSMGGGDTITLPAGTYYFTKFTLSGGASISLAGPVRILSTGDVSISGGSVAGSDPYQLRFWSSGGKFSVSSSTLLGFTYAPNATGTISSARVTGSFFAKTVTVSGGSSHVTRVLDDVAPTVTITSPAEGSLVPDPAHVTVTGTVFDGQALASLVVNGRTIEPAADGSFQVVLDLSGASPATVGAVATDLAGNSSTARVTVRTVPSPAISLVAPAPGSLVGIRFVDLSGSAGTAISLTVNGRAASIAAGAWFFPQFDLGPDGSHALTIVGSSAPGSDTVLAPVITNDTRAPDLAISLPAPGSCLAAATVTLQGTMSDIHPATVAVTLRGPDGAAQESIAAAISGSSWTATVPLGAEGRKSLEIDASDAVGHHALRQIAIHVDRTDPVIEVSEGGAPMQPGRAFNRSVTMYVRASDGDSSVVPAAVIGGTPYVSGTSISDEGSYVLTVNASDCAGNAAQPLSIAFSIDRTAPALLSAIPANGATLASGPAALTGTVGEDVATVSIDGAASAVPSGGAFTLPYAFAEGVNRFQLLLVDKAGNRTQIDYEVTIKTIAPSVQILESGNPIPQGAMFNRPVSPQIVAGESDAVVTASLDGTPFTFGTQIAAEGQHTLIATAADPVGNSSTAQVSFTIDLTPPVVKITPPGSVTGSFVEIRGTAGDSASVTVNGHPAVLSGGTFVLSSLPLDEGENLVVALGRDAAGNFGRDVITVMRDAAAPGIILTSPSDGMVTNRHTILVQGRVLTPGSSVSVSTNGSAAVNAPVDPAGSFRLTGYSLTVGENVIEATARAPNDRTTSISVHVIADFTPPSLSISANGQPLADGERFVEDASVTIAIEAGDDRAGATATLTLDGIVQPAPSLTLSAPGGHSVVGVARDAAGNESRLERTFFIGNEAGASASCDLRDFDPADGSVISGASTTLVGRTGGAAAVLVGGVPAAVSNGTFAATVELPAEGENSVEIRCSDSSGAQFGDAVVVHLIRATGAPSVSIDSPSEGGVTDAQTVVVSGTVGPRVTAVDVNGAPGTIAGTEASAARPFRAESVPLVSGLNVLGATARNAAGRAATVTRRVTRLGELPSIVITSPATGEQTGATSIDVSGTWMNLDPSTLAISTSTPASTIVQTDTSGSVRFAAVPLVEGAQTLTVTGRDRAGRSASASIMVERLVGTAPAIEIVEPLDNAWFSASSGGSFTVRGTFSAVPGATVDVNGTPATIEGATFTATVPFATQSVTTPVVARVTEPSGATAWDLARVSRISSNLSVRSVSPDANAVDVAAMAVVLVGFSSAVEQSSVRTAFHLEDAAGTAISGQLLVDRDVVSFAPAAALMPGGRYTIRIGTAVRDIAGNALNQEVTSSFTVAATAPAAAPQLDPIASPVCASQIDVRGAAAAGSRVELRSGGLVLGGVTESSGRFSIALPLSGSGFQLVRVRSIAPDGTPSPDAEAKFEVDCEGPQVSAALYDRLSNLLTITFSRPMEPASIESSLTLKRVDGSLVPTTVIWQSDSVLAITPAGSLADEVFTVVLTSAAKDTTGRSLTPFSQVFSPGTPDDIPGTGPSFISGEVFDATTGRPLAGATVLIDSLAPPITDSRGRYATRVAEGAHRIAVSETGYTSAWRRVVAPAGAGVIPIDIRLTAIGAVGDPAAGDLQLTDGADTTVTKRAMLRVPSASRPLDKPLSLTSVGAQAIAGLLPLGWSPLASAEIGAGGGAPLPAGEGPGVRVPGSVLTFDAGDITTALALARYDSLRDEWLVIASSVAVADGKVETPIEEPGAYALVYPDPGAPAPIPGAPLRGVPDPCPCPTPQARSFVLDPPSILPGGRTVVTLITDVVAPSGTPVQAWIDEELTLADGSKLLDPPFSTDLLLYRSPDGTVARADFHLAPSRKAADTVLDVGYEHIRILPYAGRLDRGALIGPEGGRVPSDGGASVEIPAGATEDVLSASATSISDLAQFGPIEGFDVLAGFTFAMQRTDPPPPQDSDGNPDPQPSPELLQSATAVFNLSAPVASQLVLVEVLDDTPFGRMFRLAALAERLGDSGSRYVTRVPFPSELPLDGIASEGRYLLLAAKQPIAFATGAVRLGAAGRYLAQAGVTTAGLGVSDLSRITGLFSVPVLAAPAAPFSLVPRSATLGSGAKYTHPSSPDAGVFENVGDLQLVAQPPRVVSTIPAAGSTEVSLAQIIQVSFAPSIDPASVNDASIALASEAGATIAGVIMEKNASGFTWRPSFQLTPNTKYFATVSPAILGANGAPFGMSYAFAFSTVTQLSDASVDASRIHIAIPANGQSRIWGDPGAIPAGWNALAVRRGRAFMTQYQGAGQSDRSFSFIAGNSSSDAIAISDSIDLHVINTTSGAVAAIVPLTPFVSADGTAFVTVPDRETRYTTAQGITVTVPPGAFEEPAVVTATLASRDAFADVPKFDDEISFTGAVNLTFDCSAAVIPSEGSVARWERGISAAEKDVSPSSSPRVAGMTALSPCIAKQRIQLQLPAPGADPSKQYVLGWLGQSIRGPRLMIVDTLRIDGSSLTTALPTPAQKMSTSAVNTSTSRAEVGNFGHDANTVYTGSEIKDFLLGVERSGIYAAVDLRVPVGTNSGFVVIEANATNVDLFWDQYASLYASSQYLTESRGRAVIPIYSNTSFKLVGVDASTGLEEFSKVYDPIPNLDPGTAVPIESPRSNTEGPYPVFGTPFRVETVEVPPEGITVSSLRNFDIRLDHGFARIVDSAEPLAADVDVELLNPSRGVVDTSRADGLQVAASEGDRVVLLIGQKDVDPDTALSIVFSEPISTGGSTTDDHVDAFLHGVVHLWKFVRRETPDAPWTMTDVSATVRFTVDSGGRRLLIRMPASLERGATYQLRLEPAISDVDDPPLKIGQVRTGSTVSPALTTPLTLSFRVRAPQGEIASFDIRQDASTSNGAIRDLSLNGNVLLIAAAEGGILAYDVADPASMTGSSIPLGSASGATDYWGIASDHHGRIFSVGTTGMFGVFRSYRLEDFLGGPAGKRVDALKGSAVLSWIPGSSSTVSLSEELVLSDRKEAIPRKIQILLQDSDQQFDGREAFKAMGGVIIDGPAIGEFEKLRATIPIEHGFPYRLQRITVENTTLDMRWSADAFPGAPAVISNIVARSGDRIRVIRNERTWAVVALFGYGIGVYDVNAIESNDLPSSPGGPSAAEQILLTDAPLREECTGAPLDPDAIADLMLSPESALVQHEKATALSVYALELHKGVLDIDLPLDRVATTSCVNRAPVGMLLDGEHNPRIAALDAQFAAHSGRSPSVRYASIASYRWTLEAQDNKALRTTKPGDPPAAGARGSVAGTRVVRDYVLVPGYERGLLVIDSGQTGSGPLQPASLADVIWVASGAVAVRVIPRADLATVVDGEGRILLVDLSRIDERFDDRGYAIDDVDLFPTAFAALAGKGDYGVGMDDPRILWKSEKGVAGGPLAPVIDADTGMVYAGRLLEKRANVLSAIDPHIEMKIDAGRGGLSEVSGIVPLGVDPPDGVLDAANPEASAAAFRLELTLPGGLAAKLPGGVLRVAVESERVFGAATEQTPEPLPPAHLRTKRRDGSPEPRPASTFIMERLVPAGMEAELRHQKGFNKFISPWIVGIADPRASDRYAWGSATVEAKRQAGCFSCDRPQRLRGKIESDGVFEMLTAGRLIAVRPEICSATPCTDPYGWLGSEDRLTARFSTVMSDTVRTPDVLVAAQNPPVASGMLQETTYLHSGELGTGATDLDAGGRAGWNVSFDRTYRSRTIGSTPLGDGWTSSMFRRLRALPSGDVEYRDGAGETWLFRKVVAATVGPNPDAYRSPAGLFLRLARTRSGWIMSDQRWRLTMFDEMGRMVSESDEFRAVAGSTSSGNTIQYLYDASGRLAQIVDPVGRSSSLEYWPEDGSAKSGRLHAIADWRGRRVDYDYDLAGRLVTAALPDVANTTGGRPTVRYAYGPVPGAYGDSLKYAGDLLSIQDPAGSVPRVRFTYGTDANRERVVKQDWATGESATFAWSPAVEVTDALGQVRSYGLTPQPSTYFADRAHVASIVEMNVPTSTARFGELPADLTPGEPAVAAKDRTTTIEYDYSGLVRRSVSAGIRETLNTYRSVEPQAPGSILVSSTTNALVGSAAAKMAGTAAPVSITTTWKYQSETSPGTGNLDTFVQSVKAGELEIQTPEPHRGRMTNAATNDSITSTETYGNDGLLKEVAGSGGTDAGGAGSDVKYEYAGTTEPPHRRSLPTAVVQGELRSTSEYPDPYTVKETDERGIVTTTTLNAWLKPTHVVSEGADLSYDETWEYDANGRVTTEKRKQGDETVTTRYEYDALGRQTKVSTDNVEVGGVPRTVETLTSYDIAHRKTTTTLPGGATVEKELDPLGRLLRSMTNPGPSLDPIQEKFSYDLLDHQATRSDLFTASAAAYDAYGRNVANLRENGTSESLEHDAWGRVTASEIRSASGAVISRSDISMTAAGRIESVRNKIDDVRTRTTAYAWDGGGRTTATATEGRAARSSFDSSGRTASSAAGEGDLSSIARAYDRYETSSWSGALPATAKRSEKSGAAVSLGYEYDTAGNATRRTLGSLEWTNRFDQSGNVVEASQPSKPLAKFEYDARGALTKETMADGAVNRYEHAEAGAGSKYTDPVDEPTSTVSDLIGRPRQRSYVDGTTELFTYEGTRVKTYTDRQGRTETYEYDGKGHVIRVSAGGGKVIAWLGYDDAGRLVRQSSRDASIEYANFDLEGRPRKTTQTRYANGGGPGDAILDQYVQEHGWNVHGERETWTMPSHPGFAPAGEWTRSLRQSWDAAGNLVGIERTLTGGSATTLLTADYRSAGRPDVRTITATCPTGEPGCTPANLKREYSYDGETGLLSRMRLIANGLEAAGSAVTYDGVQLASAQILGISGDTRYHRWTYDDRGRLSTFVIAKDLGAAPAVEQLTPADFRTASEHPPGPGEPPSQFFTEQPGHKIATMRRGDETRAFSWNGSERRDDGRYVYEFDESRRLVSMTEKLTVPSPMSLRRIRYAYDGRDRMVGRRAEYAALSVAGTPPAETDWKVEDRADVLAADGLPADVTFCWDAVTDTIVSVFKTGSSAASFTPDAQGGLLRQIIPGGYGYDDPIETAYATNDESVHRLYPLYDEASAHLLQAIVNERGEVVSRHFADGAYGEEEYALAGVAVDRVELRAAKKDDGTLDRVEVTIRTTEKLRELTLASGTRLAAVDGAGEVLRSASTAPTLMDDYTVRWTLPAADWSALTDTATAPAPSALSIAVTSNLRAAGFADVPVLPAPDWVTASRPVYSSAALPVEVRESLTSLSSWLASAPASSTSTLPLYEVASLSALGTPRTFGGSSSESLGNPASLLVSSSFQALPFVEPATGLVYARARWLDAVAGLFLTPDPRGYRDSSDLYAFTAGNAVNGSDPTGEITIIVHGTGAKNARWWNDGSFARAVDAQTHDVWKLESAGGKDVSELRELRYFGEAGRFSWSGHDTASDRLQGARDLAMYINTIRRLYPNERIRVVTHSHGGNVATAATNKDLLDAPADIDTLVLLSKPYLSGLRELSDADAEDELLYPPDFARIGGLILNAFSPKDDVQTFWAGALNFEADYAAVHSDRMDPRSQFASRYVNVRISTFVGGIAAHSVVHNTKMGEVIGRYLVGDVRSHTGWTSAVSGADLHNFMLNQTRYYNPYYSSPAFVGFYDASDTGN